MILRAGPYCCAEWNYGGLPPWLRDEPGVELRTWNAPYLQRTEKYLRHLFAEIQPSLATQGGPIIAVQLENEYANIAKRYKQNGNRYLTWILELGRKQGIDVPVVMCEGGAKGALEAFNGFSINEERISDFRKRRAEQPLMWTELWPGWYDTWSREHHVRDARNIAYHLLRFAAAGGTTWNYYMWHGGTNFGRTSMYLQVNSYDFDAPLDEWGRLTRKGAYLSALHKAISDKKSLILNGKRIDSRSQVIWRSRGKELRVSWNEQERRAVLSDEHGKILFDTEEAWSQAGKSAGVCLRGDCLKIAEMEVDSRTSSLGKTGRSCRSRKTRRSIALDQGRIGLLLVFPRSHRQELPQIRLHLPFCGDFLRIYVNGKPVAQTAPPMKECRGPTHVCRTGRRGRQSAGAQRAGVLQNSKFRFKPAETGSIFSAVLSALSKGIG